MRVYTLGAAERTTYTQKEREAYYELWSNGEKETWLILNIYLNSLLSWTQNVPALIYLLLTEGPGFQWNM